MSLVDPTENTKSQIPIAEDIDPDGSASEVHDIDTSQAFSTDRIFKTREEVEEWVKGTGRSIGVSVAIRRSDKLGKRGTREKLDFCCEKSRKFSNKETVFGSKRVNCPFRLKATSTIKRGGWHVKVQNGRHNHQLLTTDLGAKAFGRLKKCEKAIVNEYVDLDVTPKNTLISLQKKDPTNASTLGHIYRQRHRYRKSRKGPRTDMQELLRLIDASNYLCWSRKKEGSDIVSDLMWAHPSSIKLLRLFPKVLILDATYKTNKYMLPLLQIVGVTNTEISFQVAFAFLGHELTNNFTWALEQLKAVCDLHGVVPEIFLTDRELGSMAGMVV